MAAECRALLGMQMMRYSVFTASLLAGCAFLAGCVRADGPYNQPLQAKLRVETKAPRAYTVQVADKRPVPFGADGCVVVEIPRLYRAHKTYLFGVAKVGEISPDDAPAITFKKDGKTIRTLSLNDLKKLPSDSEGSRVVNVE